MTRKKEKWDDHASNAFDHRFAQSWLTIAEQHQSLFVLAMIEGHQIQPNLTFNNVSVLSPPSNYHYTPPHTHTCNRIYIHSPTILMVNIERKIVMKIN